MKYSPSWFPLASYMTRSLIGCVETPSGRVTTSIAVCINCVHIIFTVFKVNRSLFWPLDFLGPFRWFASARRTIEKRPSKKTRPTFLGTLANDSRCVFVRFVFRMGVCETCATPFDSKSHGRVECTKCMAVACRLCCRRFFSGRITAPRCVFCHVAIKIESTYESQPASFWLDAK